MAMASRLLSGTYWIWKLTIFETSSVASTVWKSPFTRAVINNNMSNHVTCRSVHISQVFCFQRIKAPYPWPKKENFIDVKSDSSSSALPKQILLTDANGNKIGVMTEKEAESKAIKEELKLFISDASSKPYAVYKLLTGVQLKDERMRLRREKQKTKADHALTNVKTIEMHTTIQTHDLNTKIKRINSLLDKGHPVRVRIQSQNSKAAELMDIYSNIEKAISNKQTSIIVEQKAEKGKSMKCLCRRNIVAMAEESRSHENTTVETDKE